MSAQPFDEQSEAAIGGTADGRRFSIHNSTTQADAPEHQRHTMQALIGDVHHQGALYDGTVFLHGNSILGGDRHCRSRSTFLHRLLCLDHQFLVFTP